MDAKYAKILWEYHHLNQIPKKADCILALGSHDLHVAERAAELFLEGYSKLIVFILNLNQNKTKSKTSQ